MFKTFLSTLLFCLVCFFSFSGIHLLKKKTKSSPFYQEKPDLDEKTKKELDLKLEHKLFYDHIGHMKKDLRVQKKSLAPLNRYTLELKMLSNLKLAEAYIDQLKQKGIHSYYTPLEEENETFYHVRKGLFTNLEEAQLEAKKLLSLNLETRILNL